MITLPTLAEVVQDRTRLSGLPFGALWALLIEAGSLQTAVACAMAEAVQQGMTAQRGPEDRAVTLTDCAARLRITIGTARSWFSKPPFDATVLTRSKSRVLVSEARFDALLREGLHAPSHRPARRAGPRIGRPQAVRQGGGVS